MHEDICDREEEIVNNFLLIAKLENSPHELMESTDFITLQDKARARYEHNEQFIGGFIYRDKCPICRIVNFRGLIGWLPIDNNSIYLEEANNILSTERTKG